jgi:hypothetical protein
MCTGLFSGRNFGLLRSLYFHKALARAGVKGRQLAGQESNLQGFSRDPVTLALLSRRIAIQYPKIPDQFRVDP